jgi:inhibitor of KinA sporulation pathway (predicted exonuclease)
MPHLLVVDVEATCWSDAEGEQTTEKMEVIEFGCVVSTWAGESVKAFSQLVRPVERPILTSKCIELTGITQAMVDDAPVYLDAIASVNEMLEGFDFDCWLSWGKYDYQQLTSQLIRSNIAPEFLASPHVNFRDVYKRHKGSGQHAHAHAALADCGLAWEGNQHRALSDAVNYARLVKYMSDSIRTTL